MKSCDAAIVIADIEESSEFSNRGELKHYNRMVREYHQITHKAVCTYQRVYSLRKRNLVSGARGDEVILIVYGLGQKKNALHALNLALVLRETWLRSKFNRKRINEGKDFTHIRVGVSEGKVAFENNPWENTNTPEGFPISQAKRIEGVAGADWVPAKILIKSTLRTIVVEGMPNVAVGDDHILRKLKGVGDVRVFPIVEYKGWLEEIQRAREKREQGFFFLCQKGYAAAMAGDYTEAEKVYRKAVGLEPDFALVHHNLANALSELGKNDEAVMEYREAIRLEPGDGAAYNDLGVVLSNQGKIEEAIAVYRKAIELKPSLAEVHCNLGVELGKLGNIEEEILAYRKAIELRSDLAEAHYNLGVALGKLGNTEGEILAYRKAIELRPDDKEAYWNLGLVLEKQASLDEAIAAYTMVIRLKPDDPEAHNNLGVVLEKQRKTKQAITAYRKAIGLNPNYAIALVNLAVIFDGQGQRKKALQYWERALKFEEDSGRNELIKKRLAEPD